MFNHNVFHAARSLAVCVGFPIVLSACSAGMSAPGPRLVADPALAARYADLEDGKFHVPAVAPDELNARNARQLVSYDGDQPPGTIIVDTPHKFLYLVQAGGKALRYGVGVGKEGLEFKGSASIDRKGEWPHWTPTPDMISRDPQRYAPWKKGMDGGEANPLGARALYLFKDGRDTLFRIHGTNEPSTIGKAVSSGCIRMMNQDVIDLYQRVPKGTKVVVQ
jgi:lipoprotein-anchoring transpeptidase ErfK/SrfK